jgi:hypothetical protein
MIYILLAAIIGFGLTHIGHLIFKKEKSNERS